MLLSEVLLGVDPILFEGAFGSAPWSGFSKGITLRLPNGFFRVK
jgi:hypothetical protein